MLLAGAGAGKTKTLISKIAYLLEQDDISPYDILALTFSNKAAREMRERLTAILPTFSQHSRSAPLLSTFHSFCATILRQESEHLGLSKNFSIYDDGDSEAVVKGILAKRGISIKQTNPKLISTFIERCKNRGINTRIAQVTTDPLMKELLSDNRLPNDPLYSYFVEYEEELTRANAVDFGGLITSVLELFLLHPAVLAKYQHRFRYILVDEYQDTNRAQFVLLYLLAMKSYHLCVVGDEDQSIYSWRGADIKNILDFERFYPNYQLVKLEQNYRSSSTIIAASSAVIANNIQRKGKKMWTANTEGDLVQLHVCRDDIDEATCVVNLIDKAVQGSLRFDDIAIFYRSNACSRVIEDELRRRQFPYRVVGGIKFYERKEVKDILAYLKLLVNSHDNVSLARIINVPIRGIGPTSLKKIEELSSELKLSLFSTLETLVSGTNASQKIKLSAKSMAGLKKFVDFIHDATQQLKASYPSQIYQGILTESGYKDHLLSLQDQEAEDRWENLEQLYNAVSTYERFAKDLEEEISLGGFLQAITLDQGREDDPRGLISLMTVHAAKGLEFSHVYLLGAEEGTFPSYQSLERGEGAIEEERRLFYVAMTRAMDRLTISYARGRMLWGQIRTYDASQFLQEIPVDLAKWHNQKNQKSKFDDPSVSRRLDLTYSQTEDGIMQSLYTFPNGSDVVHEIYGAGKVVGSEGSGNDEKVTIKFNHGSLKKFMVKFANLERMKSS